LCADVQARPLMKNGFVQASLSTVRGARTETADRAAVAQKASAEASFAPR